MIKVDIKTVWDDECGNIDYKRNSDVFKIKMTGGFHKWDTLSKLDFFKDLEHWMQTEINNIHKNSSPAESFVHSYVMGTPKSTEQFTTDRDPVQFAKRQKAAKQVVKDMNMGGKRCNNIINFPKKTEANKKVEQ